MFGKKLSIYNIKNNIAKNQLMSWFRLQTRVISFYLDQPVLTLKVEEILDSQFSCSYTIKQSYV